MDDQLDLDNFRSFPFRGRSKFRQEPGDCPQHVMSSTAAIEALMDDIIDLQFIEPQHLESPRDARQKHISFLDP